MYDIYGMSNTVSGMLPFTVLCMCSVACTHCTCAHLFFWVCVCDGAIMYVLCRMYLYMNVWCIHTYTCGASDSHIGLEGDQTVRRICIIIYLHSVTDTILYQQCLDNCLVNFADI